MNVPGNTGSSSSRSGCHLCGRGDDHLYRCVRCRTAIYCSKEHQKQHWKHHKNECSTSKQVELDQVQQQQPFHDLPNVSELNLDSVRTSLSPDRTLFVHQDDQTTSVNVLLNSNPTSEMEGNQSCIPALPAPIPFLHKSVTYRKHKEQLEWMQQICQYVAADLEKYGICVVDNFVGKERAESIHRSVVSLYHSGVFVEGETVSPSSRKELSSTKNVVRSDKIAWVDGSEKNCADIAYLISTVDTIVMNLVRMRGNRQLNQRTIGGRTKAMIACYPGSGSHYVKHVDNPNRDGRCITSTYYVNKDWDAKTVGGILRIFPQGWSNQVVDIEPILDRMVFFWSDRRNPHEVQPAYRTRYAITVWYFDAKEREEARQRYNNRERQELKTT